MSEGQELIEFSKVHEFSESPGVLRKSWSFEKHALERDIEFSESLGVFRKSWSFEKVLELFRKSWSFSESLGVFRKLKRNEHLVGLRDAHGSCIEASTQLPSAGRRDSFVTAWRLTAGLTGPRQRGDGTPRACMGPDRGPRSGATGPPAPAWASIAGRRDSFATC
eukprot:358337-Chlamydomonas_euryale.AAC.1